MKIAGFEYRFKKFPSVIVEAINNKTFTDEIIAFLKILYINAILLAMILIAKNIWESCYAFFTYN